MAEDLMPVAESWATLEQYHLNNKFLTKDYMHR